MSLTVLPPFFRCANCLISILVCRATLVTPWLRYVQYAIHSLMHLFTLFPCTAIPTVVGGGNHTPEFAKAAATIEAHEACLDISKALAATGLRVLSDADFYKQVCAIISSRQFWLDFVRSLRLSRRTKLPERLFFKECLGHLIVSQVSPNTLNNSKNKRNFLHKSLIWCMSKNMFNTLPWP